MVDGALSDSFDAGGELVLSLAWTATLTAAVLVVLRRAVGRRA
jgi:hypothetical protein